MITEEYKYELNGEEQDNYNQAFNLSVYFIDLRIEVNDKKFLFYFFIDQWPVEATK